MNKTFLEELSIDDDAPISVACDNTAARDTAYNPEHQSSVRKKVKHIERRHFYVRTYASASIEIRESQDHCPVCQHCE